MTDSAASTWDTYDSRANCPRHGQGHWSDMPCTRREPHKAHVWNNTHCLYGPYYCEGRP